MIPVTNNANAVVFLYFKLVINLPRKTLIVRDTISKLTYSAEPQE